MDKNTLKRYMRQERELRKKHADLQMILFGMFMFILILLSCCFAFIEDKEGADYVIIFPYFIMENFAFMFLCQSVYIVREKNQLQSVFAKMLYVPRNMRDILAAKALVMIKDMGIVVIVTQFITVLINIPFNGGKFVVFAETFAPLYVGLVCMIVQLTALWGSYKKTI